MRVEGLRYRDEWLSNFFPPRKIGPDHFLRLSRVGTMQILSAEESKQLEEISMSGALYERLEKSGHIVTSRNAQQVMADLKRAYRIEIECAGVKLLKKGHREALDASVKF